MRRLSPKSVWGLLGVSVLGLVVLLRIFYPSLEYGLDLHRKHGQRAALRWLQNYDFGLAEPNISWQRVELASEGIDPDKLARLRDYLAERDTDAFLVAKNGKIVEEWYPPGKGPNQRHYTAALSKAITGSLALLIVIDDSRIDLDEPVSNYIPQWQQDEGRSQVTIRQLATHSSGIEDVRFSGNTKLGGWRQQYKEHRDARFSLALSRARLIFEPGERYEYSGLGFYVLAYSVTRSLRDAPKRDIRTLLDERIMTPIGIPRAAWTISYNETYELDGMNLVAIGSGGEYTPRAIARIGQLLLQRGEWGGQQLISPEIVAGVFEYGGSPEHREFGPHPPATIGWWTNDNGFWPYLPRDAIVGAGIGHQVLLVIPSHDLVVVRLGQELVKPRIWGPEFWTALGDHLLKPLMECLSGEFTGAV